MIPNIGLMRFNKTAANRAQLVVRSLFANGEQGAWYDPSDFSTMFQDAAGTTPVTVVGQPVGLLLDKSGRGNHASQATTANRPVLQQDAGGHYYLAFNGTNSSLSTAAINFTATDKMTVWAGVRKLSDAATGMLVELGPNAGINVGSFYVDAPEFSATYGIRTHGTVHAGGYDHAPYTAPITNVLSTQLDNAGILITDQVKTRINGLSNTVNGTGPTSAGNFGNYPLYIGTRAGTSLFFNGNLYGLIVRGAASSAAQISNAEAYMNSKTGAY